MFANFKDKFLRSVSIPIPFVTPGSSGHQGATSSSTVNLNSGCDILSHYQKQWEILHATTEQNAADAEAAAATVARVAAKVEQDKANLTKMTHILTCSGLTGNLEKCNKTIDDLYKSFENIEQELVELEDMIEEVEMEERKKEHRYHLRQYKERKEEALENFERGLRVQYDNSLEKEEVRRHADMKERQQVFQTAFKNDLKIFRSLGTIPKMDLPQKQQPSALLEEIQVDYDQSELDKFFGDDV